MNLNYSSDIQLEFAEKYRSKDFVTDKSGVQVVEIINASFIADSNVIFGEVNSDWNARELSWYNSMSLNVNDIPAPIPAIWKAVATPSGEINSNYGWCVYSKQNGNQFDNVIETLSKDPLSRRAEMIYTRPSMHTEYNRDGMSDFMCTETVQYVIRDNLVHAIVKMRSNDAIHGYKGDYFWQNHMLETVIKTLNNPSYSKGLIYWNSGSLHIYDRHFPLIEKWINEE